MPATLPARKSSYRDLPSSPPTPYLPLSLTPNPDYWDDLPGTGVPVRKSPTPVPSEHNPSSISISGNWEPIEISTPVKYFLIGLGFTTLGFAVYFLQNSV